MLNVPVNNFSVMLGRGHRFLGITSTFGGKYVNQRPLRPPRVNVMELDIHPVITEFLYRHLIFPFLCEHRNSDKTGPLHRLKCVLV